MQRQVHTEHILRCENNIADQRAQGAPRLLQLGYVSEVEVPPLMVLLILSANMSLTIHFTRLSVCGRPCSLTFLQKLQVGKA